MNDVVQMINIDECNVDDEDLVTLKNLIERFSNLKKENKKLKGRTAEIQLRMEQVRDQKRE